MAQGLQVLEGSLGQLRVFLRVGFHVVHEEGHRLPSGLKEGSRGRGAEGRSDGRDPRGKLSWRSATSSAPERGGQEPFPALGTPLLPISSQACRQLSGREGGGGQKPSSATLSPLQTEQKRFEREPQMLPFYARLPSASTAQFAQESGAPPEPFWLEDPPARPCPGQRREGAPALQRGNPPSLRPPPSRVNFCLRPPPPSDLPPAAVQLPGPARLQWGLLGGDALEGEVADRVPGKEPHPGRAWFVLPRLLDGAAPAGGATRLRYPGRLSPGTS